VANRTKLTLVTSFRIFITQHEELQKQAHMYTMSSSVIVRALLQLYLDGKVPEALTIALAEAQRAEKAELKGKQ